MIRLLIVQAIIAIDSGKETSHSKVFEESNDENIGYAILSHRWNDDEVNYDEMIKLNTMTQEERNELQKRKGYRKILGTCKQAVEDQLEWLWVDTCCIDRRSSAELSEAICSMYRWYENSRKCYVYLCDVKERAFPTKQDNKTYNESNGWPKWFSRGWTLQELIAPKNVQFFNWQWVPLGYKQKHASTLQSITRIPEGVLKGTTFRGEICVAQIMSWAADRRTSRPEDRAYSLLGIFGVTMPMLYGEGSGAFQRLQLEIIRVSNDQSIFAWDPTGRIRRSGLVLADDPSYFQDCHDVKMCRRDPADQSPEYTVTNRGIKIPLLLTPYRNFPTIYRAELADVYWQGTRLTIDLESLSSNYYRSFSPTNVLEEISEPRDVYLACHQGPRCCNITLDETTMSRYGFTRCGAFPSVINGNRVVLSSLTRDPIVITYYSAMLKSRFAVGLGYYRGEQWVHVVCDDAGDSGSQEGNYAEKVHAQLRNALIKSASPMGCEPYRLVRAPRTEVDYYIKHAHLPRSIYAAKISYGKWEHGYTTVTIDVDQCAGCCYGPLKDRAIANTTDCFSVSGLPRLDSAYDYGHWLLIDGMDVKLLGCTAQKVALGDYGDWDYDIEDFKRDGNIFEDIRSLPDNFGIDTENPAHRQVQRAVSSFDGKDEMGDFVKTTTGLSGPVSVFHRARGASLPNTKPVILLLKALSTRLTNKYLVTTVVLCSAYSAANSGSEWAERNESGENGLSEGQSPDTVVLYDIAQPHVWLRDTVDEKRRGVFKEIREQFYVLLKTRSSAGIGSASGSMGNEARNALDFFLSMFGVGDLRGYVGDVTFKGFVSILSVLKPQSGCEPTSATRTDTISAKLGSLSGVKELETAQDLRAGAVAEKLLKVIQTGRALYPTDRKKIKENAVSISKTLGFRVLREFCTAYACLSPEPLEYGNANGARCNVGYDCYTCISSGLRQIETLQAKLDASNDEDEKRALEEDITGKILWICWQGICLEEGHVPEKVIDSILRNEMESNQLPMKKRRQPLQEVIKIFREALAEPVSEDQHQLRRIMVDAEEGISKYDMLRSAQTVPAFEVTGN